MVLRLFFLLICIYHDNLTQKKTQIKLVRKCLDQGKFEPPDLLPVLFIQRFFGSESVIRQWIPEKINTKM